MKKPTALLSALLSASLTFAAMSAPFVADAYAATATATQSQAAQTIASGTWIKKSFTVDGSWEIYAQDGKTFLRLSDDFKTKNAPDLKLFLSPLSASDASNANATQGAVLIAPLQSNKGGQVYELPAGIDLSSYKSVLLHCEAYTKLWSASDL